MYRVKCDPPDYQIGHGPDDEFVVVSTCLSAKRAEQIARLLNKDIASFEPISLSADKESQFDAWVRRTYPLGILHWKAESERIAGVMEQLLPAVPADCFALRGLAQTALEVNEYLQSNFTFTGKRVPVCTKCGQKAGPQRRTKYCGDGSDKDNEHHWETPE